MDVEQSRPSRHQGSDLRIPHGGQAFRLAECLRDPLRGVEGQRESEQIGTSANRVRRLTFQLCRRATQKLLEALDSGAILANSQIELFEILFGSRL